MSEWVSECVRACFLSLSLSLSVYLFKNVKFDQMRTINQRVKDESPVQEGKKKKANLPLSFSIARIRSCAWFVKRRRRRKKEEQHPEWMDATAS